MDEKSFMKSFESRVERTIKDYKLINKKDKVLVAYSGGKDSTVTLYLLNKVEAVIIDLLIGNYSKINLENTKKFCKEQNIKLNIISFREEFGNSLCFIRSILKSKGSNLESCTICGILKRWLLNKKSRDLKATKLATGHNIDDEAQTILMNILKGNPSLNAKLSPMTGTTRDKKFTPRIKPLYFSSERDIERYSKLMKFPVKYGHCPCSSGVFRFSIKEEFKKFKDDDKIKLTIVTNFLKDLPLLRKQYKGIKMGYCKKCKEPSKGEVCSACKILDLLYAS